MPILHDLMGFVSMPFNFFNVSVCHKILIYLYHCANDKCFRKRIVYRQNLLM